MPELDPGIHEAVSQEQTYRSGPQTFIMDCRVKPGNDAVRWATGNGDAIAATTVKAD